MKHDIISKIKDWETLIAFCHCTNISLCNDIYSKKQVIERVEKYDFSIYPEMYEKIKKASDNTYYLYIKDTNIWVYADKDLFENYIEILHSYVDEIIDNSLLNKFKYLQES